MSFLCPSSWLRGGVGFIFIFIFYLKGQGGREGREGGREGGDGNCKSDIFFFSTTGFVLFFCPTTRGSGWTGAGRGKAGRGGRGEGRGKKTKQNKCILQ